MVQSNIAYGRMDAETENSGNTGNLQIQQQQQISRRAELTPRERHKGVLFGLGITEIVIGSLSVLLGILALIIAVVNKGRGYYDSYLDSTYYDRYPHAFTWPSQGIWCGVLAIVSGILGVKAKSNPSVCMYNANMALSIIGANFMGALMAVSCNAAPATTRDLPGLILVHSLLAVLGFTGAVICIVHSAYCCVGVCCRRKSYLGAVMYVAQPGYQPQQMVQLANGQYMMVPAQAMAAQYPAAPVQAVGGQAAFQSHPGGLVVPVHMAAPQSHLTPSLVIPQQATASYPAQQDTHPCSKE